MADDNVDYMLTTVDNPFNPHTHFDEWFAYDQFLGHKTIAFLGRVVKTADDLPDSLQEAEVQRAIDEIVRENVSGLYRKVAKP